jgi:molecular chaperone Hsp33
MKAPSETATTMADLIVSASAPDAGVAFVCAITTDLVTQARSRHDLAPTATAALGRLMTAAALLGTDLQAAERTSLQIFGDGPIGGLSAEAWRLGDGIRVRGRVRRPFTDLPLNERGKFDVAGAIGAGVLQVTRSYEIGQPYVGVVPLRSGEIAEDVAAYLGESEQIPNVVSLGVLADPNGVRAAGGLIARVLPGADESVVAQLEERALSMASITSMILEGADARALMNAIAGDLPLRARQELAVAYACLCTREKVETVLVGLGADELRALAAQPEAEIACEFCKRRYDFNSAQMQALIERLTAS